MNCLEVDSRVFCPRLIRSKKEKIEKYPSGIKKKKKKKKKKKENYLKPNCLSGNTIQEIIFLTIHANKW